MPSTFRDLLDKDGAARQVGEDSKRRQVFAAVAADSRELTVHVSFMELYNEELRDLLDKDGAARQVGEDSKRRQVFAAVAADARELTVHVSFMELYNEELRDLLDKDCLLYTSDAADE